MRRLVTTVARHLPDRIKRGGVYNVLPFYTSREQEQEEKKFVSPLERPKKREIKNNQNKLIYM